MTSDSVLPDVFGLLPHRYPFLLLDRVTVVEQERRVRGVKLVTSSEWFFGESALAEAVVPGERIVRAELTTVLRPAPSGRVHPTAEPVVPVRAGE
ncbi:MAG: hypothetical protein ACR2MQ_00525 [Gemmatimonadaceae bacterium]